MTTTKEPIGTGLGRVLAMRTGDWLLPAVEKWVEEHQEKGRTTPGWVHASELSSPCDAYLAFCYLGTPKQRKYAARTLRIFDNGSGRDHYWKKYLRVAHLSVIKKDKERRGKIEPLRITLEIDDLVRHPLTQELWVVEFKTMNSGQFNTLHAPMPDHRMQVQPYMCAFQVPRAIVLYENKDNQEVKTFQLHFDTKYWNELTTRLEHILGRLDTGVMPERNPTRYESTCPFRYCCSHFEVPLEKWKILRNSST